MSANIMPLARVRALSLLLISPFACENGATDAPQTERFGALPVAQAQGNDAEVDANPCVPNVLEQTLALRSHADGLGFVLPNDAPEGNAVSSHYQGVQRYQADDATNYLLVTRSGGQGEGNAGDLTIVRMGSRDASAARFRSNRLARGSWVEDTPPDERDQAVRIIFFNGANDPKDPGGLDLGVLPHYRHVSAPQIIGDILALPLEERQDTALPEGMVLFFDVSDPVHPVRLAPEVKFEHAAGTVAITRRPDERYFLQITGPEGGEKNYYYVSNTTDLREPGSSFSLYDTWENELLWGNWPTGIDGKTSHQSFNFIRQCGDDRLYMLGTRNDNFSPILGDDKIDVYEVFLQDDPIDPETQELTGEVQIGQVVQDAHMYCSFTGTGDTCNFQAAGGTYVAPDGELIVYGMEFHNDGPKDSKGKPSVRFGEFRHRDIARPGSPTHLPLADGGGPYTVDEGSEIELDASGSSPPTARPWVELYDDNCEEDDDPIVTFVNGQQVDRRMPKCRRDRSILMDWVARNADDYDDLDKLAGFNKKTSAVRWWTPKGCDVILFAEPGCGGDTRRLAAPTSRPGEIEQLDDLGFGDKTKCVKFGETAAGACEPHDLVFGWSWTSKPQIGMLDWQSGPIARFSAIDGDANASIELEVCSDANSCDTTTAEIDILNVDPEVKIDAVTDETGAVIGVDVPVVLEGLPIDLAGSFTDDGVLDSHTAAIDWGDGAVTPDGEFETFLDSLGGAIGACEASHTYSPSGTYTITLGVLDKDSGQGTSIAQVEVVNASEAIEIAIDALKALATNKDLASALGRLEGEADGTAENGAIDLLDKGNLNAALGMIARALDDLAAAEVADPALDLTTAKSLLALAAKSVAVKAIANALAANANPEKIDGALDHVAEGDDSLVSANHAGAVRSYQKAVREVQGTY
jgi:hypothetical protein